MLIEVTWLLVSILTRVMVMVTYHRLRALLLFAPLTYVKARFFL